MTPELSPEIEEIIRHLGTLLNSHPLIQAYLEASTTARQDAQLQDMEARLYTLYEQLITRQQAGENLPQEDIDAFTALRQQVFTHPLIIEREARLKPIKSLFAEVAAEISAPLGVEYTALTGTCNC